MIQTEQQYDILISVQMTSELVQNYNQYFNAVDPPRNIDFNYAAYDVRSQQVIGDNQWICFSHPNNLNNNDQPNKEKGFFDLIQDFNDFIYNSFSRQNLSYCLITYGDELLTRNLPFEAKHNNVKLHQHYYSYFEIVSEFRKFCPTAKNIYNLRDILNYLNLKDVPSNSICQFECKSLVRLTNILVRNGHMFQNPKILNTQHKIVSDVFQGKQFNKLPYEPVSQFYYVRMRGLPFTINQNEVFNFLQGTKIYRDDIVFKYNQNDGKFSGECIVRLGSRQDLQYVLQLHMSKLGNRYVEVFDAYETNFQYPSTSCMFLMGSSVIIKKEYFTYFNYFYSNQDYKHALISRYPDQNFKQQAPFNSRINFAMDMVVKFGQGILRLRGLEYEATPQQIYDFFRNFRVVTDGYKRGYLSNGKIHGEAFLIFESEIEADNALEQLNGQKIGQRYIELFKGTPRELDNYLQKYCQNSVPATRVYKKIDFHDLVPEQNRERTLKACGLPFTTTPQNVVEFFDGFNLIPENVVLLLNPDGKFTGMAYITFPTFELAMHAKSTKHLEYMGSRYIELSEFK